MKYLFLFLLLFLINIAKAQVVDSNCHFGYQKRFYYHPFILTERENRPTDSLLQLLEQSLMAIKNHPEMGKYVLQIETKKQILRSVEAIPFYNFELCDTAVDAKIWYILRQNYQEQPLKEQFSNKRVENCNPIEYKTGREFIIDWLNDSDWAKYEVPLATVLQYINWDKKKNIFDIEFFVSPINTSALKGQPNEILKYPPYPKAFDVVLFKVKFKINKQNQLKLLKYKKQLWTTQELINWNEQMLKNKF